MLWRSYMHHVAITYFCANFSQMNSERLKKIIVVGDRVLIKPKTAQTTTRGGLVLPPGYSEKEEIQTGYVIKTGRGIRFPYPEKPIQNLGKRRMSNPIIFPCKPNQVIWWFLFKKVQLKWLLMEKNTM